MRSSLDTGAAWPSNRRLAWRSRARSIALRTLRALANCGCCRRRAMYSRKVAQAAGDSRYLPGSSMSIPICSSSPMV